MIAPRVMEHAVQSQTEMNKRFLMLALVLLAIAAAACGNVAPAHHNPDAGTGSGSAAPCVLGTSTLDNGCSLAP